MSSYVDLATARDAARATISAAGASRGWPSSDTAAMLLEIDSAASAADGWFSSDASECAAFWTDLNARYAYWPRLDGMDKIGAWLAAEAQLVDSVAATAEAQATSTIVSGAAAAAASDALAIGEAGGEALSSLQKPTTWYLIAVGAIALWLWKVAR